MAHWDSGCGVAFPRNNRDAPIPYRAMKNYITKTNGKLPRPFVDLLVISSITVAVFVLGSTIDISERYIEWAQSYERWNLDELPMALGMLALGFGVYAVRRWRDLEREIAERKRTEEALRASEQRHLALL